VETVMTTLGQALGGIGAETIDPSGQALVQALLRPGGVAALGMDPQGPLVLTLWQVKTDPLGELSLPFAGTPQAAMDMLATLGPTPEPTGPASWRMADSDGTETLAHLADGMLVLAFDGTPPTSSALPPVDLPLVQGLSDAPGCAVYMSFDRSMLPGTPAQKAGAGGGVTLAAFIPFARGGQAVARLRSPTPLPAVLSVSPAAPFTGTSTVPPSLVLSLGMSAEDLISDPEVRAKLHMGPGQADRVLRHLNFGAGATVASFGDPRALDIVAVLPLDASTGPIQQRKVLRHLVTAAHKAHLDIASLDHDGFVVTSGKTPTFVQVREGRVIFGPDHERVMDAAEQRGAAWARPEDVSWALQWPVSLWSGDGGPSTGPFSVSVRAGIRGEGDIVEAGFQVQTGAPPGVISSFLTGAISQGLSHSKAAPPDPVVEIQTAMEGIALAEEVHRSVQGSYLALPAAPRAAAQVDAGAVPWQAGADWQSLGWQPDAARSAVAYWVELSDDGEDFVVHAEADLDGDGEHARYERPRGGQVQATSPQGVR